LQNIEKYAEIEKQELAANNDSRAQIARIKAQIKALQAAESLKQALTDVNVTLDIEVKRNTALNAIEKELAVKMKDSKNELEAAELDFVEAKKLEGNALRAKMGNDNEYNIVLVPGRVELSEISEKKERLAALIKDTQKSFSTLEVTEKERLDSKLETKGLILAELKVLEEQLESLTARHHAIDGANQECKDNWEREIKELDSLESNLRNTMAAKEAQLKNLSETQAKRRRESLDEARALAENENAKSRRLLKILGSAEKYIAKAKYKVKLLGEDLDM
jgi:hypothetical protein